MDSSFFARKKRNNGSIRLQYPEFKLVKIPIQLIGRAEGVFISMNLDLWPYESGFMAGCLGRDLVSKFLFAY